MSDDVNNNARNIIEPSILAGFQEFLPKEQMLFTRMQDLIRASFESYGFIPLDTPVLEKSQVLLAKSGGDTAKQVYRYRCQCIHITCWTWLSHELFWRHIAISAGNG